MPSLFADLACAQELRRLYTLAQDPQANEFVTRRFWTALFQRRYHQGLPGGIYIADEQPPNHGRRRVDSTLYRMRQGLPDPLLYVEYKRTNHPHLRADIDQITNYCQNLLRVRGNRSIEAMLCYGTWAAVWKVRPYSVGPVSQYFDADQDPEGKIARAMPPPHIHP